MTPRTDNPALYRENVYKSWQVMTAVVTNVAEECFVAHLEPNAGAEYDCLSLVTRDNEGHLEVRFMLNRNGENADILERVWRKVEARGVDDVAEQLIEKSRLTRTPEPVATISSTVCRQVVEWIEKHRDEEFTVSPIDWFGACTEFLDIPLLQNSSNTWPIPDHGPELVLGIGRVEKVRIMQDSGNVYPEPPAQSSSSTDARGQDKFYAYLYRDPKTLKIRYVGYATNPSRAYTDGHNELIGDAVKGGEQLEILIAGPYRDEAEARNVEAALVSAIQPELNLIQQPGIKFHPLGVPSELGDRRFQPVLDVHEIGRIAGGALVVYCDLTSPLYDQASKVSPTNFTDDVVFANIQDHWRVKDFMQGWIENPASSPTLLVAVQGPPKDRIVIGSARIDANGWATTIAAPHKDYLHRIPLDKTAGLDNAELRGRRVSVKFNSGPSNIIMYVDGDGLVLHGYQKKGKTSS